MPLATQADVESWLGRDLTTAEEGRVDALLARAESLVLSYLGCDPAPDPVPDAVKWTVAEMVGRLFVSTATPGVQQVSADDASVLFTQEASSGSPWLSKADRAALRPFRCSGGLVSVQLVGSRYNIVQGPS